MEKGLSVLAAALFTYGVLSWLTLLRSARQPGEGAGAPRSAAERAWGLVFGRGEFGSSGMLLAVATCGSYVLVGLLRRRAGAGDPLGPEGAAALLVGVAIAVSVMRVVAKLRRASYRCSELEAALRAALRKVETLKREQRAADAALARATREKEELEARAAGEQRGTAGHEAARYSGRTA